MKKAKDIMEPVVDTLTPETVIRDAILTMRTASRKPGIFGVKGILVLNANGTLAGMLTIRDILSTITPKYMEKTEIGAFSWPGMLEDIARRIAEKTVGDVMSTDLATVSPEATLMECAVLITRRNVWRIPVIDDARHPVGIVYVRDLHYAIVDAILGPGI